MFVNDCIAFLYNNMLYDGTSSSDTKLLALFTRKFV